MAQGAKSCDQRVISIMPMKTTNMLNEMKILLSKVLGQLMVSKHMRKEEGGGGLWEGMFS
jgi:hypothetical protein